MAANAAAPGGGRFLKSDRRAVRSPGCGGSSNFYVARIVDACPALKYRARDRQPDLRHHHRRRGPRRGRRDVLRHLRHGFFTGTEVGLQGFKGLEQIGAEAFTGVISSVANTREITPLIAGVALAAQVGAGFTAQLGAMRISDEIDALEVMGVAFEYLVATRVWAALLTMIPLYLAALFASYLATEPIVTEFFGLVRPVPALLQPVPAADRHLLLVHQGPPLRHRGDPDPLLLRLLRHGRAGRRGPGDRSGHPGVDRRRRHPELRAVAALLGRPGHGEHRRMRRIGYIVGGLVGLTILCAGVYFGVRAAYGAYNDYYYVTADLDRADNSSSRGPTSARRAWTSVR